MPAYAFEGFTPVVDARAFVHPLAVLIGDVRVGPDCYVAPGASLEQDSHVGHGAVLHGCSVRRGALIGIHAVVMDDAEIGEESFVGAASFVRAGFVVPPRTLVTGTPARVVRELKPEELAWKATGTREYQELAARCLAALREVAPLAAPEPGRPVRPGTATVPLHTIERGK